MARCEMNFNEYTIGLTKREFVLVTKALSRNLNPVAQTVQRKGVEIIRDDYQEAEKLGIDLMERRVRALEKEQQNALHALDMTLAAEDENWVDGGGE